MRLARGTLGKAMLQRPRDWPNPPRPIGGGFYDSSLAGTATPSPSCQTQTTQGLLRRRFPGRLTQNQRVFLLAAGLAIPQISIWSKSKAMTEMTKIIERTRVEQGRSASGDVTIQQRFDLIDIGIPHAHTNTLTASRADALLAAASYS